MPKKDKSKRGRFVVFEGPDSVGKTTQAKLLFDYLKKNKFPAFYISFPRYEKSMWGGMVKRYLNGDFGSLDGYLASLIYAGDRFSASEEIRENLKKGKIVVCDRYIASNIGHQAAKFATLGEQNKFIKWLEKLEYLENNIPREDLVLLLNVPFEKILELLKNRSVLDIHEKDKEHLVRAHKIYARFYKTRNYWHRIDCVSSKELLSKEEIHKKIVEFLESKNYI